MGGATAVGLLLRASPPTMGVTGAWACSGGGPATPPGRAAIGGRGRSCVGGLAAPLGRAAVDRRWCATVAGRLICLASPPLTGCVQLRVG